MKHAFPKGKKGEVSIDLHLDKNDVFTLRVHDDGIGLPGNLDLRNIKTLGLLLVNTLVTQLDGTIEISRNGGSSFKITFSELVYKQTSKDLKAAKS